MDFDILENISMNTPLKLRKKENIGDRFIPKSVCSNLYDLYFSEENDKRKKQKKNNSQPKDFNSNTNSENYLNLLQSQLFDSSEVENFNFKKPGFSTGQKKRKKKKRIMRFKSENKNATFEQEILKRLDSAIDNYSKMEPSYRRKISKHPSKILDAPSLQDDYYLNLMDWSRKNQLAIGLDNLVYLWSASNSKVTRLCEYPDDKICSVSWSDSGRHNAVGNTSGEVEIFDTVKMKSVRIFEGHTGRVGSLHWNGCVVASGSRDRSILLRDVREHKDYFTEFTGPKQEICGLKWSFDEHTLASGGNDNRLFLWSLKEQKEITRFEEHTAAVKALGWSPNNYNLLASGGGTADRCLRFWNTQTLEMTNCIDTGSQVCNLVFSKNSNEMVSTHGFSLNQIIVWDLDTMEKLSTLTGHSMRVLYLSMSPDGQTVVTGAGDETLRFWNIFPEAKNKNKFMSLDGIHSMGMNIR